METRFMSTLFLIGLGLYMSGHGIRGISQGALLGSCLMIVGGILVTLNIAV